MYARYPAISINNGSQYATWTQWCGQAISDGELSSQQECNERLWPTKRGYQFSPTADPVPGWDPATMPVPQGEWTNISQQPPFSPAFVLFAPTGSYARVAYLTDAVATNQVVGVGDWNAPNTHLFFWSGGYLQAAKNQRDVATDSLTPSRTWARARGVYMSPTDAEFVGDPANVGPLTPHESIMNVP